jgi:integrase
MANVTFVLKEPNSKEPTLIYLMFTYTGQRLKYSTGLKINPKFWNNEKQLVKETRQFSGYSEYNTTLTDLASCITNTYRKLINDKAIPTPEKLKQPLNELLQKEKVETKDLLTFSENLIENSPRKSNTKRQLRQALRNLREFKDATKHSLHLDEIDLDFYDEYIAFLTKKNYSKNTIGTLIKNLKVFMNEAVDRKLTTNLQFKNRRFKTMEEHSENIYLSQDEIRKLHEKSFSFDPSLERVKELFIIGCCTGLRFSDLATLTEDNFIDKHTKLKIKTEKTGELVIIPLHRFVREIFKKNDGKLPKTISNQKMNDYLKQIAELAEFNEQVSITSTKGGKSVSENFKKYELVTVHTARRSFATNAYLADVPTISIMKITGHRTEKAFMRYIKISQEDNANKLLSHPFFK